MTRLAQSVVRDVQQLLGVSRDGKWGPDTQSAYEQAAPGIVDAVDELIKSEGYSVYSLRRVTYDLTGESFTPAGAAPRFVAGAKATPVRPQGAIMTAELPPKGATAPSPGKPTLIEGRWISPSQLETLARAAGARYGVPTETLVKFVGFEAAKKAFNGTVHYDVRSRSPGAGTYRGLGQMGPKAWSDIQTQMGFTRPFSEADDPEVNLLATAAYAKLNERYLRNKGYKGPLTAAVLYAAHNQGAGGFMDLLKGGSLAGKQGGINEIIAQAKADAKVIV